MPLIGTAGHVDHGKSTLIRAITGRDPDRWAAEKERGLTIDLGFAWATLPDGTEVSFVDVPGHERFLKNMLAGIEAIDVALFVVAADEGWMPQSEEHLAVLDLLEVNRGVVALTKVDTVDEEVRDLATLEITERLAGTSLEDFPIVPVSAVSGEGIDALLLALVSDLPPEKPDRGRPRLWVDRSFPISGAGTVVTGSLLDGTLTREMTLRVYPGTVQGRVRGIQSHERPVDTASPGVRVAVNLGGLSHDEVVRGDMLGLPGQWRTTRRIAVSMRTTRFVDDLDRRGAYQIHVGSSAHEATIIGLESGHAVVKLDREIPLAVGDRFILRDTGRHLVVAGGRVLDPAPGKTVRALRSLPDIDPDADPDVIATHLLAIRSHDSVEHLSADSGGGSAHDGALVGGEVYHPAEIDRLQDRLAVIVDEEHERHPLRPGVAMATVAGRLGVDASVIEMLVDLDEGLMRTGPSISRAQREMTLSAGQEEAWRRAVGMLEEGLDVPAESDLGLDADVIGLKLRTGELVRIAPGLVYLARQVESLKGLIRDCGEEFTVAGFRDSTGLSRKYAVPILEWSDKEGLTVRRGNVRSLR